MIKKYQAEAPEKIKFFQFEPKGISAAMNRGVEKSSGEFLIHCILMTVFMMTKFWPTLIIFCAPIRAGLDLRII